MISVKSDIVNNDATAQPVVSTKNSFNSMGLAQSLVDGLKKMGITAPTPVQEGSIPIVMSGKDVQVRAKTGSGKTYAFALPMLSKLNPDHVVQGIVLAPTRELAVQIGKDIRKLDPHVQLVTVYGGVGINPQIEKLHNWAQVVIGTPGRILDHLERRTLDTSHIRMVVLDEADRMFEMGFIDDMKAILQQIPKERQTLLFSATMPDEVVRLSKEHMREPEKLLYDQDEITVKNIKQVCYGVDKMKKLDTLMAILRNREAGKVIIFCNTKRWSDTLSLLLRKRGFYVKAIHSDLSQRVRQFVIDDFKAGKFDILVATDVAARGLHIENVTYVVNYDLPKNPKDYIHRIGRTGRIGKSGAAFSLVTQIDQPLLRNIEREIQQFLQVTEYGTGAQVKQDVTLQSPASHHDHVGHSHEEHAKMYTEHNPSNANPSVQREHNSQSTQPPSQQKSGWDRWD